MEESSHLENKSKKTFDEIARSFDSNEAQSLPKAGIIRKTCDEILGRMSNQRQIEVSYTSLNAKLYRKILYVTCALTTVRYRSESPKTIYISKLIRIAS